ncbi:hypothetical protein J2S14_003141 [Lederbergia wuyishanensis]|uniref:Uncharacterized protein n=1 Tax=Lederbergia wuyishanensis TaxID=1347903 RepID=A0ABU0D794_9BACI|nr:hypothetical protein [Lederbergia wuyishanensis]
MKLENGQENLPDGSKIVNKARLNSNPGKT